MKKNALSLVFILFAINSLTAQNVSYPEIPYIEVTGSADIEIEPDEIRLAITIASYETEKEAKIKIKTTKEEIKLEEVDKKLNKILSKVGISKNNIILKNASLDGYWSYWWCYRNNDVRMTKQYEIIFDNYEQMNKVLAELPGPKEGCINVNISSLKNKKITEYRKQTKIEAIKAAKEKARYLLESVGNKPGKLIQIIELDEDDWNSWYRPYNNSNTYSNAISQVSLNAENENGENSAMQKIKLRYRIKVRFEIQE